MHPIVTMEAQFLSFERKFESIHIDIFGYLLDGCTTVWYIIQQHVRIYPRYIVKKLNI